MCNSVTSRQEVSDWKCSVNRKMTRDRTQERGEVV